jgi:hypothetical protein
MGLTWTTIGEAVREAAGRPDAHAYSIERLNIQDDGFDGFRVKLGDFPPCKSGPRKGKPNYRKGTNLATRLISDSDVEAWLTRWVATTGKCGTCRGDGQTWAGWSAAEGTRYTACRDCNGTGSAP